MKAFAIYDLKAAAYAAPFFFNTAGLAVRAFTQLANDVNTTVGQFPEDYTLYEIGTYDEQDGRLENHKQHVPLGKAVEYIDWSSQHVDALLPFASAENPKHATKLKEVKDENNA